MVDFRFVIGVTRLRTALIGVAVSLLVFIALVSGLVALDLYLHRKFDAVAGLNYRGYRGAIVGRKAPGEIRVGLFGGSIATGYGVKSEVSIASVLERALNDHANDGSQYRVVNLAMNGESDLAYFRANYQLFRYLNLDVVLFYVCSQDSSSFSDAADMIQWTSSIRSSNTIMRTFGYYFILPTVAREKYYLWKYGSVEKGYVESARHAAGWPTDLYGWFDRITPTRRSREERAMSFGAFVKEAVRENKKLVLAVCPGSPPLPKMERLEGLPEGAQRVVVADLNGVFPREQFASYFLDGMHYNAEGNRLIGETLARRYIRP